MAETPPQQLFTFKVIGRLVKGIIDTEDSGQEPDFVPVVAAKITFTPNLLPPVFKVPTATEPITVFQETISATTDVNGYLVTTSSEVLPGVILPYGGSPDIMPTGWNWAVTIDVGGSFPVRKFSITGNMTGDIVDLATAMPVPADPGKEVVQWTAVVSQTLAARDAAVAAAAGVPSVDEISLLIQEAIGDTDPGAIVMSMRRINANEWNLRPSTNPNVVVFVIGPDPSPLVILPSDGVNGMYSNDVRIVY